jgi:hypothetical protein
MMLSGEGQMRREPTQQPCQKLLTDLQNLLVAGADAWAAVSGIVCS